MPIGENELGLFNNLTAAFGAKWFIVLFLIFYTIVAIILHQQVKIMCTKLITPLSPHLRFFSILNIGISIAILFLVIGSF